jgi:glutamine amidotransferase
MSILILDYGMANLRSVQKAFERVGHAATITADANQIADAEKIVLPGVGAFKDAILRIREVHFAQAIEDHLRKGKRFFGICLGMQMLFERGYEDGIHTGLGILAGDVVRFENQPGLKIPHMGWNRLTLRNAAPPLAAADGQSVYFVHSYYPVPKDEHVIAATADYPTPFTAAIWQENIVATQFHPEKSQGVGLEMLKRFAQW